jgi:FkbM family methyltransferase
VFDVGANKGQSVIDLASRYPKTTFHCFEPGPGTFPKLVRRTKGLANVKAHSVALGREEATLELELGLRPTLSRLVTGDQKAEGPSVQVKVRAGAEVLDELGESHIDFLKIDTEGHDYDVLQGFLPVIQQVDFVQVEAAMNAHNKTHVPFWKFQDLLAPLGFYLFHIFEQVMEWKEGGRPVLRRSNPVYINGRLVTLDGIS